MALDANIVGSNVDANGRIITTVGPAASDSAIGLVGFATENDAGTATGARLIGRPETSEDYRLRVGVDSLLDSHTFNTTGQNQNKHQVFNQTMTVTSGGATGFVTNASSITTTTTGAMLRTYKTHQVFGAGSTYLDANVAFTATCPTFTTYEIGFGLSGAGPTNPWAPTEGVFFRYTNTGMQGVAVFNSSEIATSFFTWSPTPTQVYKFTITASHEKVLFWIDDVLHASLDRLTTAGSFAQSSQYNFYTRHVIVGGAAGATFQTRLFNYAITLGDMAVNRLWATTMAAMGYSAVAYVENNSGAQSANYGNSTQPASAALSNTTAGYTTLGGQFQFAAVAGAETDYALFAFQVSGANMNGANPNKSLVVRGVWIDTINTGAAVATTATWLQWALGVGGTAVNLGQTDAASTKSPRRLALGNQVFPIGAAIGAQAQRIDVNLDAPVVINVNEFLHVIVKMPLGTATASQIIRGVVGINGYWE